MGVPKQDDDGDELRAGDLLVGAARIAEFLSELVGERVNDDDIYYAKRTGKWPIGKHGAELIASKRQLSRHATEIASGSIAAASKTRIPQMVRPMGVPKICIIILGNPQDGFTYLGPFQSEHDAVLWAEANRSDDLWWVDELETPRNLRRPRSTKGVRPNG